MCVCVCNNVLADVETGATELVAVVDMLHKRKGPKEKRKGFRIKQVSHRNQEFPRGRNIGTHCKTDSRFSVESLQSWPPKV